MFYQIYDFITIEELLHFNVRLDLFVYDKNKFYLKITFKNLKQKELLAKGNFISISSGSDKRPCKLNLEGGFKSHYVFFYDVFDIGAIFIELGN